MRTKFYVGLAALGLLSLPGFFAQAAPTDDTQAVANLLINGVQAEKVMTEIKIDGTNVYVAYADGTVATLATTDKLVLTFEGGKMPTIVPPTYPKDTTTGFQELRTFEYRGVVGDELRISGLTDGTIIYIYNLQGMLMQQARYTNDCTINISALGQGTFILLADKNVVKFNK